MPNPTDIATERARITIAAKDIIINALTNDLARANMIGAELQARVDGLEKQVSELTTPKPAADAPPPPA